MEVLDRDDIAAGWAALETAGASAPAVPHRMRYYRPLSDAAHTVERQAQAKHRVFLGIDEIDSEMRGITPGNMAMVIGFSHSGKTLVVNHAVRHNHDKRIIWFTPDEPSSLVLTKLACAHHKMNAREMERLISEEDERTINLLRQTASQDFPNLAVFDQPLDGQGMNVAYDEACSVWGNKPDLVIFDYLELLQVGDAVKGQADWVKAFTMDKDVPTLVIHQTSRSAGAEGREMTLWSGAYGGETHATFLLGVRRKKYQILSEMKEWKERLKSPRSDIVHKAEERLDELGYLLRLHEYTITVNMPKNKRPGGRTVDDIDFELDVTNGRIYPLRNGDLPEQYFMQGEML